MSRQIRGRSGAEVDRAWTHGPVQTIQPHYVVTADGAPGETVRLHEITALLSRRKKTILAGAIAGVVIAGLVSAVMTPIYRAHAAVQIEGFNNEQMTPIAASLPNASPENYLQNQVKVLESDTLAGRVADALGNPPAPRPSKLFGWVNPLMNKISFWAPWKPSPAEMRILGIKKALSVKTSLQSQVIELDFDSPDPQRAARGANAVTESFIALNREAREQLVQDTTEWLNKQAAELKTSIEKANARLQGFALSAGLVIAGNDGTLVQEQTRQIQDALLHAAEDRAAKQSRFETVSGKDAMPGADLFNDALENSPYRQYQIDLANMRKQLAELQTMYTPTNYKVQKLQAQIATTEHAMEDERKANLARIDNEFAAASRLEKILGDVHNTQVKSAEKEMANDRQYNTLKSEIDTMEKLYEDVLQKAKEEGAASALRATNVRLIDAAVAPSVPYSPRIPLNLAIGLLVGTIGGVGLVVVTERSDKVKRPGEVHVLDIPELGVIPSAKDAAALVGLGSGIARFGRPKGQITLIGRDPRAAILGESFRGVLTSILFRAESHTKLAGRPEGRALVITSVDMMEGKTTVTTNLGIVAAERRQRVLLIDCDLRRPRLHQVFDLPNNRGLTDLLLRSHAPEAADNLPLEDLVRPTNYPRLFVLPSGPVDADSTKLLFASDLRALLQRCRKDFDLILIDTPPMLMYADSRILGRESDGLVMVVRANTRSHEDLKGAYDKLRQDRIPMIGTILNDWKMDPENSRAYGKYRTHYHQRSA